jgi:hypothetical protein
MMHGAFVSNLQSEQVSSSWYTLFLLEAELQEEVIALGENGCSSL